MKEQIYKHIVVYDSNSSLKYFRKELDGNHNSPYTVNNLHKHDDFQLIIIDREKGQCMVGSSIEEYIHGDILLIGRNVPHCYNFNVKINIDSTNNGEIPSNDEILHFRSEIFPVKMDDIGEYRYISALLKLCQYGIIYRSSTLSKQFKLFIKKMNTLTGIARINELMLMLDTLGRTKPYRLISSKPHDSSNALICSSDPLQRTFDYIYLNYKENITLKNIANYALQNPSALCRSFKKFTGISIFQFINKIRIENACKLLMYHELTISQVAYESGFNSLSHFNRQFKTIVRQSPTEYRSQANSRKG